MAITYAQRLYQVHVKTCMLCRNDQVCPTEGKLYMEWSQSVGLDIRSGNPVEPPMEVVSFSVADSLKTAFPDIEVDCDADGTPLVLRYGGRTFRLVEEL